MAGAPFRTIPPVSSCLFPRFGRSAQRHSVSTILRKTLERSLGRHPAMRFDPLLVQKTHEQNPCQRHLTRSFQRHTPRHSPPPPFCREVLPPPPSPRAPPRFGHGTSRTRQSGGDTPPPLPLLTSVERGTRFRRECLRGRFGREFLAGDAPSRPGCCCCYSVPPSVPRRS